jgi:hypothetical protein
MPLMRNVSTGGQVSASGNITGNVFIGNGSQLTGITSSYGNANVVANLAALGSNPVSTTGNVTGANINGNGSGLSSITGANVTGTVANATYATSSGSATTADTVTGNAQANITSVGVLSSLSVSGNIIAGNLNAAGMSLSSNVVGALNVTGAIAGSNITTPGVISATGNITGGNLITSAAISAASVSASGNITGGNILGGANVNATTHTGTTASLSGNITGGNILTGGLISATANVNGGNLISAALVQGVTVSASGNVIGGNVNTNTLTGTGVTIGSSGNINLSASGNIVLSTQTYINNLSSPVQNNDAATKQYVDDIAQGLHTHDSCNAATTTILATISSGTVTYNNGTSGVGATLTTTGTYTTIDGVTLSNGMRILVKNEANTAHNGIYDRTSTTVLTRSTDFDTTAEMAGGDFTFVTAGTLYDNTGWVMTDPVTTVGTSPVPWVQFSGAGTYTAGTGLTLNGSEFSVNASQTQVTTVGTLGSLAVTANITGGNILVGSGIVSTTGNITGGNILGGANVNATTHTGTTVSVTGNVTGGNIITSAAVSAASVSVTGNITAGNILGGANVNATTHTGTTVSVTGNITGGNILGGANVNATTLTGTTVNVTGNVNGGNLISAALVQGVTVSASGNVVGGNVTTAGLISATGNITAGNILGGANVNATTLTGTTVSVTGNITAGNVLGGANVNATTHTGTTVSVTGNITGGNLLISGSISDSAQLDIQTTSANANIVLTPNGTGNVNTGANVSVTGNITGGNILGGANVNATTHTGTTVSVSGNITGGNILTAGQFVSTLTGNVGNGLAQIYLNGATLNRIDFNQNGTNPPAFTTRSSGTKIVLYPNIAAAAADYAFGIDGGVLWSGVPTTSNQFKWYAGTTQVAALGGGGNLSITGGVTAVSVVGGVMTGSSLSVTGNVTGGNLITAALAQAATLSATANVQAGNLRTTGLISATGAITGAAITGTSLTVSTGNVTLGNIINANGNGVGNIGSSALYFNTVFAKATSAQYADLAEWYSADADYAPGTVLSFGGSQEVTMTTAINDPKIAGVVSTNPAHVMNAGLTSAHTVMVALAGRVPTLVIGTVAPGDMMVSAGGGRAKACATPAMGTVIGKALQNHPGGQGTIEVVIGRI